MADYPSWSDERDAYADQAWSSAPAPPAPPPSYGYPGADSYHGHGAHDPYAPPPPAPPANRGAAGYAGYENRGAAGYGGGANAANTGYAGGAGGFGGGGGAAKASDISYDTSSRDPAHLRARVFIGSLGRGPIVREDIIELCRPFGPLMAVTLFKQGYAFVQYEQAEDADNSCEVLNGKRWKGVNIDVHLAMEGLVKKTLPQKRPAEMAGRGGRGGGMMGGGGGGPPRGGGMMGGGGGGDRGGFAGPAVERDWPGALSAKRSKPMEEPYIDINEQNRKNAMGDNSQPEMIGTEMADTLICGTCRYVTSDFIAYREHRKKQCVKPKDNVEPPVLRCASCGLRFLSAWKMLFHLTDFHRMQLFKPDYTEEALERAKMEDEKYKTLSATRMEQWRAEQEKDQSSHFVVEPLPPAPERNGGAAVVAIPTTDAAAAVAAAANKPALEAGDNGGGIVGNGGGGGAIERVTTGADYDEDEEDEEDGQPSAIPSLG